MPSPRPPWRPRPAILQHLVLTVFALVGKKDHAEELPDDEVAEPSVHAIYQKVINGRCGESIGELPLGGPGIDWADGLDQAARDWCDETSWCVGYMRYIGKDASHCEAWCGRPQFCGTLELTEDDDWVTYLKPEASQALMTYGNLLEVPNDEEDEQEGQDAFVPEQSVNSLADAKKKLEGDAASLNDQNGSWQTLHCEWPYQLEGRLVLWFTAPNKTDEEQAAAFGDDWTSSEEPSCHVLYHKRSSQLLAHCSDDPGDDCNANMNHHFFEGFHGVLSEDEELIPYFTANSTSDPWVYAVESNEYIGDTVDSGGGSFGPKKHYLSIFFLSNESACDGKEKRQWGPDDAESVLPGHVYIDDGSEEKRRLAFKPYHFTVICGDIGDSAFVPQAVVDAFGFAAHPLVSREVYARFKRVFFHLPDAAQPFSRIHPKMLEQYVEDFYTDPEKNEAMYFKQTFMFLMQDLFRYRYRQPPQRRLELAACALCAERQRSGRLAIASTDHAVVEPDTQAELEFAERQAQAHQQWTAESIGVLFCVMSRRSAHLLRQAIRETWAQRLPTPIHAIDATWGTSALRFFVGSELDKNGGSASLATADSNAGDVVELAAPETYKAVTLKAFSMIEWAHRNFPNLRFLIRADDDVYLRPVPLLRQLHRRSPVMYLWGNIDHGSSPVRDPEHPHFNSQEQFPERKHPLFGDIFPPYARGHLWAMSADLVAMVAEVWRNELGQFGALSADLATRLPHPDDPALGVALANLVEQNLLSLNFDDRDLNVFALNPSCNATYLNIHSRTWAVHHVNVDVMRCMWAIDMDAALDAPLADLCPCSIDVVEEISDDGYDEPFDYPRERFNE